MAARPRVQMDAAPFHVHETVQERTGRHDERVARVHITVFKCEPGDASVLDENAACAPDDPGDVRLVLERFAYPCAVALLVRLCARRPHGRTTAPIEQLELNPCRVDRASHQSTERVDLANQVSLRRAADRRIARHVRDGVPGQRADRNVAPHARRGPRGFDARVSRADDDDVVAMTQLLTNAKAFEDDAQHFVFRARARDLVERAARRMEIDEYELLG